MQHSTFNPEAIPAGIKTGRRVIGYSTAIRTIDIQNWNQRETN